MAKLLLFVSGVIYAAMAAVHGLRYSQGTDFIVAGRPIPLDASMIAAAVLVVLALLCWVSARRI